MDESQIERIPLTKSRQCLFFVHIPKTAGRTLINVLERHFLDEEIFPYSYWNDVPSDLSLKHLRSYRLFRGHFFYSTIVSLLPNPPVTLTILRHPIDRILSAYNHTLRDSEHPHHHAIGGATGSLMDYINMPDKTPTRNPQVTFLSFPAPKGRSVLAAQQSYSSDPTKLQDLDRAKEVLHEMAAIGIQEDFGRSIQLLNYTFRWDPIATVRSENVGQYRVRPGEREPQAVACLHELNELDFELYNYGKQLFEERYQAMVNELLWADFNRQPQGQEKPHSVHVDLGRPFMGEGWYAREKDPKGIPYCWMGFANTASVYTAVAPSPRMCLEVAVKYCVTKELLNGVRIAVNGQEIPVQRAVDHNSGLTLIRGEFPGGLMNARYPITTVRLHIEKAVRPRDSIPGNNDPRQLGIAVSWIDIKPVAESGHRER